MRDRTIAFCLVFFVLVAGSPALAGGNYVLAVGHIESSLFSMYDMDTSGRLSLRYRFDIKTSNSLYGDTKQMTFSPAGNYLFVHSGSYEHGLLYSVLSDYRVRQIAELSQGAYIGGGGFSTDERYFFASTDVDTWSSQTPRLKAYRLNGDLCTQVFNQTVPTTAAPMQIYQTNRYDEVIASGLNVYQSAPVSALIYQFNRTSESLAVKQYIPGTPFVYAAQNAREDRFFYGFQGNAAAMAREPDGHFTTGTAVDIDPGMWEGCRWNLYFIPGTDYAVLPSYAISATYGGLVLFRVGPGTSVERVSLTGRLQALSLAMTPDGKYFVLGYNNGYSVGTFRLNYSTLKFDEIATTTTIPNAWGMSFHPGARPTRATPAWEMYE